MNDQQRSRLRRLQSTLQGIAPVANGLLLLAFLAWVFLFDGSRSSITDLEELLSAQTVATESGNRGVLWFVLVLAATTLLTMFVGLWRGRRESRSLRAWLLLMFLICAWLAVWLGRHDLYWYGHAVRISSEVTAATRLADALDKEWPSGDGDYPELGFVLGYPKENPVSLILAGEPVHVGSLSVVALEKSQDGQTLRFQLAYPNYDTWLVRVNNESPLAEFVSGFETRYSPRRTRKLSNRWYLVRYKPEL